LTFPEQYINISYGRTVDGGGTIHYLATPTPGASNRSSGGLVRLDNPVFSLKSGRYTGTQTLSMDAGAQGGEIRYTLDGSEPLSTSSVYASPIPISKTTTVKARVFKDGLVPSKTEVKTFFINEHPFTLPVISLSTKPAFLFDNTIGIYADGTNGIPGNCNPSPMNWNQDWDRHAVFEYFDNTGSKYFDQHVDIRIGGACSRNNPQKSLVIKARDKYGSKTIEHRFFSTKQISEFGGFILRNGGNDFWGTMFRDEFMQNLVVDQMDIDYLAGQPAITYLNGNYWGIMNLREKIDGDYIESNYGIAKDDIDLIETYGNAIEGTADHYNNYISTLQSMDLSTPEAFEYISSNIDVQEFINYLTAEIYYCNTDWPGNNVKFWRQRSGNGKYRWILWDLDFGFALYENQSYAEHPTLDFATDPDNEGWPNPAVSTLHIRLVLSNPQFRNKFIQTLTASLNTAFQPERVINMINSHQNRILAEMPYHTNRWGQGMDNWNYQVERLRSFAWSRNAFMKNHIGSFFGLSQNVRMNISTFPLGAGSVKYNGIATSSLQEGFYYRDLPFEVTPEPAPGYKFSHYNIRKREAEAINLIAKGASWKYSDTGVLPAADWKSDLYNHAAWSSGTAELGYGDGDEVTTVASGPVNTKFITTYFRKEFNVSDTVGFSALSGSVLFDDGVVVYLNGEEVFRSNMPAGTIDNNTPASANQASETTFFPFSIPKGKVKIGKNVIAVEVHQNGPTSSDISFDLEMNTIKSGAEVEYTSDVATLSDVANSDVYIEAYFTPVVASSGLVINEVSVSNSLVEDNFGETDDWIEIYNNGTETIDITNYFVTDNLGNKTKHRIVSGNGGETLIAPGTYKLLWADGDVQQGPLHLSFKLSAEGEEVGLYQQTGGIIQKIDEVVFGPQQPSTTYSRIPNITGPFNATAKATPLAVNELVIPELPTSVEENTDELISLYPNPVHAVLRISSAKPLTSVQLLDSNGRKSHFVQAKGNEANLDFTNENAGLYFILITIEGKQICRKVVKM
jgi:hypothetical protein